MVTWSGRRREFYFFVEARLDGLVARFEDIGEKVLNPSAWGVFLMKTPLFP